MGIFNTENLEIFSLALFFISFFGIITSKNMIKSIIFVMLIQTAVIMFWLKLGREDTATPIPPIIYDPALLDYMERIADPLPQALTLTAIIIGFSVVAVIITMFNALYRLHGTADWKKLEEVEGD
ncbi:MAG: cation:proton antiporter subunit C [Defluviitaleaceae bacterium]|nr:cation:proton antiporter subunit C [Defluviitaleaceae bacterium]MCL2239235.1 cation:proton antiporter subunit C [Defluviitaleaceae bacterium]MCL2239811.1 cation:proton antiporter subunit C [Defluviitaleaceae bacterium]